jgi:hypothetical protein
LQDSKLENTMRLRLAGVNDLIAAEGKYHNKCLNAFKYDTQKTKKECETIVSHTVFHSVLYQLTNKRISHTVFYHRLMN